MHELGIWTPRRTKPEFSTCEGVTSDYEQEYPQCEGGVTADA